MENPAEPLEMAKIFQKLENESELRALEGQPLSRKVSSDANGSDKLSPSAKQRRRGSVSISRINQFAEDKLRPGTPHTTAPSLHIASKSPFYQAQIANDSTDSIASGASAFSNDHAHAEDINRITQMEHIVGRRKSLANLLPRRLSRSFSKSIIPSAVQNVESTVVIGVSVHEATVQWTAKPGDELTTPSRLTSVASTALRHQSSRSTFPGFKLGQRDWFSRAMVFTRKLTRKSKSSIPISGKS